MYVFVLLLLLAAAAASAAAAAASNDGPLLYAALSALDWDDDDI